MVLVIETLIGKGYDVRVYDDDLSLSDVMGANLRYIQQTIPHLASLICDDAHDVLDHADVLVLGKPAARFRELLANADGQKTVIDLVRIFDDPSWYPGTYTGIAWETPNRRKDNVDEDASPYLSAAVAQLYR